MCSICGAFVLVSVAEDDSVCVLLLCDVSFFVGCSRWGIWRVSLGERLCCLGKKGGRETEGFLRMRKSWVVFTTAVRKCGHEVRRDLGLETRLLVLRSQARGFNGQELDVTGDGWSDDLGRPLLVSSGRVLLVEVCHQLIIYTMSFMLHRCEGQVSHGAVLFCLRLDIDLSINEWPQMALWEKNPYVNGNNSANRSCMGCR